MTSPGEPLFPEQRRIHRIHRGLLTERQEHIFTWVAVVVVMLYVTAWIAAVAEIYRIRNTPEFIAPGEHTEPAGPPATPVQQVTSVFGPVTPAAPRLLTDAMLAFLHPLRGESGDVRFVSALPGSRFIEAPGGADVIIEGQDATPFVAPGNPGIYDFTVQMDNAQKPIEDIAVITLVPRSAKRDGQIGPYRLGFWPFENSIMPRRDRYAPPRGFIQVTPQNADFQVSSHFRMRQFLTKDQYSVWPKYLLLDPMLLDKLELTIDELRREGVRVDHVHVMSGFRTPTYNRTGGNTQGRANLSRHMYGDASDVYVDNNQDGYPDDITGDGRVTVADAEKFARAAERVENAHGSLVGGIGIYPACCGHGPFTHVDVRGFRARWRGTGSG